MGERVPIPMSDEEKARRLAEMENNRNMQNAAYDASKRASEGAVQSPKPLGPNAITEVPEHLRPQTAEQPASDTQAPGTETRPNQ